MELYCQFSNGKILPEYNTDYDKLGKLKPHTTYKISITQPRNIQFHRKVFALFNLGYENQEVFNNMDDFRSWLTMKAGYYKRIKTPGESEDMFLPESISFAKMDEIKFNEYYKRILDVICATFRISNEDVQRELINFM